MRRRDQLAERREAHRAASAEAISQAREYNDGIDQFARDFQTRDSESVARFCTLVLDSSAYPDGFPHQHSGQKPWVKAMSEFSCKVGFDLLPVAVVVADLLAVRADRKQAAQLLDVRHRRDQLGVQLLFLDVFPAELGERERENHERGRRDEDVPQGQDELGVKRVREQVAQEPAHGGTDRDRIRRDLSRVPGRERDWNEVENIEIEPVAGEPVHETGRDKNHQAAENRDGILAGGRYG